MTAEAKNSRRLDQWLWYARIFKTRGAASKFCQAKKIRLDGDLISKAKTPVRIGMMLSFTLDEQIKILKIEALGVRRGPAVEAQSLYDDQSPPPPTKEEKIHNSPMLRERGAGRPTKTERRAMERLRPELKNKLD